MTPAKLLIVDDEVLFAETLAEHLKRCGYSVSVAFDGNQAIQRFQEEQPALALVDLKLPGINGEDLIRQAQRISPRTKVIIITAYHDEAVKEAALKQVGVSGYLYKPLKSLVELEQQIEELLGDSS